MTYMRVWIWSGRKTLHGFIFFHTPRNCFLSKRGSEEYNCALPPKILQRKHRSPIIMNCIFCSHFIVVMIRSKIIQPLLLKKLVGCTRLLNSTPEVVLDMDNFCGCPGQHHLYKTTVLSYNILFKLASTSWSGCSWFDTF